RRARQRTAAWGRVQASVRRAAGGPRGASVVATGGGIVLSSSVPSWATNARGGPTSAGDAGSPAQVCRIESTTESKSSSSQYPPIQEGSRGSMCARVVRVGETSATTSNRTRRATPSEYARPSWSSRAAIGDLADHADAHAQRVARQVREWQVLDLHRPQRRARGAGGDRPILGDRAPPRDRLLARQRLKDLVDLAA